MQTKLLLSGPIYHGVFREGGRPIDLYEGSYLYCPECRAKYRPGFTEVCADCGAELVHELPAEPEAASVEPAPALGPDPVAVLVTPHEVEAEMVRGILESSGIPAMVWRSGLERLYVGAVGPGVRVMVRKEDADLAREIVAAPPEAAAEHDV